MRIAYFTHASGVILYAMAIGHVERHVEFRDRLGTLIDRAHEQDGYFHDRWRQNGDVFTSATIQGGLSMRTYAYSSASNLVKLCSVFLTDISVYFEPISVSVEKPLL